MRWIELDRKKWTVGVFLVVMEQNPRYKKQKTKTTRLSQNWSQRRKHQKRSRKVWWRENIVAGATGGGTPVRAPSEAFLEDFPREADRCGWPARGDDHTSSDVTATQLRATSQAFAYRAGIVLTDGTRRRPQRSEQDHQRRPEKRTKTQK